jgi:anhydro-N-acetylmuramic acid kinase
MRVIGLMSGTSMDGVDVALIETDGETVERLGPSGCRPYGDAERALLRRALDDATALSDREARPGALGEAERMVTTAHAEAVEAFLRENGIDAATVDGVGFHGQTVLHRPERRLTVQIGDGGALARRLGLCVVYDFRAADVAAGGQGAPLVPIFHRALARYAGLDLPLVLVNIGGVANVTFLGAAGALLGFDTGPGNALLDDFVRGRTGAPFDRDGALAASGLVEPELLRRLLASSYFEISGPKSLDRNEFAEIGSLVEALGDADGAATLAAFTVEAIVRARAQLPAEPALWVVAGGGARNRAMLEGLAARVAAPVRTADAVGLSTDAVEAQAFAYLAARTLRGLPITFPGTTGVAAPLAGGVIARP